MNSIQKKTLRDAILVLVLMAGCILLHFSIYYRYDEPLFLLRHLHRFIYAGLILSWGISANYRGTTVFMRRCFRSMCALMLFYLTIQHCKYELFAALPTVCRHLWYTYYIPMLLLPGLVFLCAACVGQQSPKISRRVTFVVFLPALVLIAAVLSNDLHQQVFRFSADMKNWDTEYRYGPVYYIVVVWISGMILAAIATLFHRCRVSRSRKMTLVPLAMGAFGAIYFLLFTTPFFTGFRVFQLPEAFCFLIILLCEALMRTGLLITNTHYAPLFSASTIHAQIVDWKDTVCYRSANAETIPDENRRFHSVNIGPGRLQWTEDIHVIRNLRTELAEIRQQLTEENELIRAENSLTEEHARTEAKHNLYATISAATKPQLQKIETILNSLAPTDDDWNEKMAQACILNAYVKRRSNLELLTHEKKTIPAEELSLCLRESLDYLNLCGMECELDFQLKADLNTGMAKGLYAGFEDVVEAALPNLRSLLVSARTSDGIPCLRLCMGGVDTFQVTAPPGTIIDHSFEDDCLYIAIAAEPGGDAEC